MKIANFIICSAAMSVVVVSAVFLSEIISIASILLVLLYTLFVSIIYAMLLLSESRKNILLKWLVSLSFSYLCFIYFWKTNYSIRALNWMILEYGRQSAGGNFAGFFMLVFLMFLCLAGILFAASKSSEKFSRYTKAQSISGTIILLINVIVVIYLETLFPSLTQIYS